MLHVSKACRSCVPGPVLYQRRDQAHGHLKMIGDRSLTCGVIVPCLYALDSQIATVTVVCMIISFRTRVNHRHRDMTKKQKKTVEKGMNSER